MLRNDDLIDLEVLSFVSDFENDGRFARLSEARFVEDELFVGVLVPSLLPLDCCWPIFTKRCEFLRGTNRVQPPKLRQGGLNRETRKSFADCVLAAYGKLVGRITLAVCSVKMFTICQAGVSIGICSKVMQDINRGFDNQVSVPRRYGL